MNLANVEEIEDEAFYSSKVQSVTISKVIKIGKSAFESSALTQIDIPNTLSEIGEKAFQSTKITKIVLPENVRSIGNYAFNNCKKLTEATIKANITAISEGMFRACSTLDSVTFVSKITTIEKKSFYKWDSLTLTLPETLTTVREKSVYGPSITNVPDSLKNIEDDSFGTNIPEDLKTKILAINPNAILENDRDGNGDDDVGERFPTIPYLYEEQ